MGPTAPAGPGRKVVDSRGPGSWGAQGRGDRSADGASVDIEMGQLVGGG